MIVRKRILLRVILIWVLSIAIHTHGWAQPAPDDQDQPGAADDPGDPGGDPDLPIDTNILVLVAAGVGYGLKKAWDAKQTFKRKKDSLQTSTANFEEFIK